MDLSVFYERLTLVHGPTGLVGKVALGALVALVASGNKRPGQQLLMGIFGVQFLMSAYLAFSTGTDDRLRTGAGTPLVAVSIISCVLGLALLAAAFRREGDWRVLPKAGWQRWAAAALIAWAFVYPVFSRHWWSALLYSPVGVLPHSTLLVAATMAWASVPNTPRLAGWTIALGAVALSIVDALNGVPSTLVLLAPGVLMGAHLGLSQIRAGGVLADDTPPIDKAREQTRKEAFKKKNDDQRTFKLK